MATKPKASKHANRVKPHLNVKPATATNGPFESEAANDAAAKFVATGATLSMNGESVQPSLISAEFTPEELAEYDAETVTLQVDAEARTASSESTYLDSKEQSVKDIKGIGDGGCERIGEAELQFWGWWKAGGEAEFAAEWATKTEGAE